MTSRLSGHNLISAISRRITGDQDSIPQHISWINTGTDIIQNDGMGRANVYHILQSKSMITAFRKKDTKTVSLWYYTLIKKRLNHQGEFLVTGLQRQVLIIIMQDREITLHYTGDLCY